MEQYKGQFLDFLFSMPEAIKLGGPFRLKSGRLSPYFVNIRALNDGESLDVLGNYYAKALLQSTEGDCMHLVGIPEAATPLMSSLAIHLSRAGRRTRWTFYRKDAKTYGEATAAEKNRLQREYLIGAQINAGEELVLVDDVFTSGTTKNDAATFLSHVAENPGISHVAIAFDRQEITEEADNAIADFKNRWGANTISIVNVADLIKYLRDSGKADPALESAFKRYLQAWGTEDVRKELDLKHQDLISGRTVVPACDVGLERFEEIVKATHDIVKIGGYKIPATSGRKGWEKWVETARRYTKKPLIYDHQKAGTDIPDTGRQFMKDLKEAGFDAVILFPQAGPYTQVAWTGEAVQQELAVLVGGEMTHPKYRRSEGGYIADEALQEMYLRAAKQGVRHFVVPGNKIDRIALYRELITHQGVDPIFFAPGFVAQGGEISKASEVAGDKWHAIVGRGIYEATDIRKAAEEHTSQL